MDSVATPDATSSIVSQEGIDEIILDIDSDDESVIVEEDNRSTTTTDSDGIEVVGQNKLDQLAADLKNTVSDDQRELMQYHLKLEHLPFGDVKKLAEQGIIHKRLAKVKPPLCHSCLMGKQHRKPWRGRGKKTNSIRKPHEISLELTPRPIK